MPARNTPNIFLSLLSDMRIESSDIARTSDGFFMVNKSIANILSSKDIFDFRLECPEGYQPPHNRA